MAFFRFNGLLGAVGDAPALVLHAGAVWDANRAARRLGIHAGQPASAARTVCPEAVTHPFDPGADALRLQRAWDLLAQAASILEPDGGGRPEAYAAWPGATPPRRELKALQAAVRQALPQVDLAIGLARGRLPAHAACPPDQGLTVVADGTQAQMLAPLPLQALVDADLLSPPLRRRLAEAGLQRCGQVAAVPASLLLARFGREGPRVRRFCLGEDPRPVHALYPPHTLRVRRAFPDGLPPEGWAAAAAELARRAAAGLPRGEGVRSIRLCLPGHERARTWKALRSDPGVLVRAAAALGEDLARESRGPTDHLEIVFGGLLPLSVQPLDLLSVRAATDAVALDDLLARTSRETLRRGWGRPDRHEALLALFDPWGSASATRSPGA